MAWQDVFGGAYSEAEQGIIETQIIEDTKYQKEPPKIEEKKEAKKEKSEPEPENKDYKKLIFETLDNMFEGNQTMADKKLVQLTAYEFTNEKKELVKVKGTWNLEELSEKKAQVVWHKLEKEIKIFDESINLEGES